MVIYFEDEENNRVIRISGELINDIAKDLENVLINIKPYIPDHELIDYDYIYGFVEIKENVV